MKRVRKMLACLVGIGILSGMFCGCGSGSGNAAGLQDGVARPINEIKDSGYIRIGVYKDNKPLGYLDENGEYEGYDVRIAKQMAKDLGVEVQLVPIEFGGDATVLEEGTADVVLGNYKDMEEPGQKVTTAMPYMMASLAVISPNKDGVMGGNEVNNKVILVVQGSVADHYLGSHYKEASMIRLGSLHEVLDGIEGGLGDAACVDTLQAARWLLNHKDFTVGFVIPGTSMQITPAVHPDNGEVAKWVNEEMRNLQSEGYLDGLYDEILQPVVGGQLNKDEVMIK